MPGRRSYPPLPESLRASWESVTPSGDEHVAYRPCRLTMEDGSTVDCAYVMDAQSYIDWWGVWPEDDPGKRSVSIEKVVSITESPFRLPVAFANELYRAGESGMGYTIFTLRFADRSEQAYVCGNAVDFVPLPAGKTTADIVAVLPHRGRDAPQKEALPYSWCLFGEGESSLRSERRVEG